LLGFKKKKMKYFIIAGLCLLGIVAIYLRETDLPEISEIQSIVLNETSSMQDQVKLEAEPEWNQYWYAGKAEISGYELEQSRYGEIHDGQATLIFVTEPFSKKKQVKLDNPGAAGNDNVSVLKLNATRKFLTGIYPYSMMTSVFNPVNTEEYESALKLTLSGQEWCGQVFMQMNNRGSKFNVKNYSYFESEGDQTFSISAAYLEDELFNLIRLDPRLLPKGEISIIPSAVVGRFMHEEVKPYVAMARIGKANWHGMELSQYTIMFDDNNRLVNIYFQSKFPYIIEGWEDTYQSYGSETLTTTAIRKNTKQIDYWNKNSNEYRSLNAELFE
jgi:hypothetical protein